VLFASLAVLAVAAVVLVLASAGSAYAGDLLVYNASGTIIRVPQLNNVSMPHVHVMSYFTDSRSLAVSVRPLTPTACVVNLSVHYPDGALVASVRASVEPFSNYTAVVPVDTSAYDYVVVEGEVCGTLLPPFAVRYFPRYVEPPRDPVVTLFWSIACYTPVIAVFLRSSPRVGGIVMLASLPIAVPVMYALGADPAVLPVFVAFITVVSLVMIAVE
jgi:hypothetical protein